MTQSLSLPMQTLFAELIERAQYAAFDRDFPMNGTFVARERNGRRYWYFNWRDQTGKGRVRYAGLDGPELQARIVAHGSAKQGHAERRELVRSLRRVARLPGPLPFVGDLIEALADAGVFRLRACLVGTVAYQTYAGLLGVKLPGAQLSTSDLDIARFLSVSTLIEDSTPPMLDTLQQLDPTFRSVPYAFDASRSSVFVNGAGFRLEFLVPNLSSDDTADTPVPMPSLGGASAQPLRFLDYLIHEAVPNVVLHGSGILVNVPAPERYAVHKLIVATRRREGAAKITKDIAQAGTLVGILAAQRRNDLADAWREAWQRGPKWREALERGAAMLPAATQETLKAAISG